MHVQARATRPDSKLLATTVKGEGHALIWNVSAPDTPALQLPIAKSASVGFSPDNRVIAVPADKGRMVLHRLHDAEKTPAQSCDLGLDV